MPVRPDYYLADDLPTVRPPGSGVWRVGKRREPVYWARPLERQSESGRTYGWDGRFDSRLGSFATTYFATLRRTAYLETLQSLRPKVPAGVEADWRRRNFMAPGNVDADWRSDRRIVRYKIESRMPFVDITNSETIRILAKDQRLQDVLATLGYDPIADLTTVLSSCRPATQLMSDIIYYSKDEKSGDFLYGGIRYVSRYGSDLECWALFDHVRDDLDHVETKTILPRDHDLAEAAKYFNLNVH